MWSCSSKCSNTINKWRSSVLASVFKLSSTLERGREANWLLSKIGSARLLSGTPSGWLSGTCALEDWPKRIRSTQTCLRPRDSLESAARYPTPSRLCETLDLLKMKKKRKRKKNPRTELLPRTKTPAYSAQKKTKSSSRRCESPTRLNEISSMEFSYKWEMTPFSSRWCPKREPFSEMGTCSPTSTFWYRTSAWLQALTRRTLCSIFHRERYKSLITIEMRFPKPSTATRS